MKVILIGGPYHGMDVYTSDQTITIGEHRYFRPNKRRWRKIRKEDKWVMEKSDKLSHKAVYLRDGE